MPGANETIDLRKPFLGHLRNRRADGNGNDGHCDSGDDDDNDDHHHNVRLVAMMIQTKTEMVMVAMKTKKTTTD